MCHAVLFLFIRYTYTMYSTMFNTMLERTLIKNVKRNNRDIKSNKVISFVTSLVFCLRLAPTSFLPTDNFSSISSWVSEEHFTLRGEKIQKSTFSTMEKIKYLVLKEMSGAYAMNSLSHQWHKLLLLYTYNYI